VSVLLLVPLPWFAAPNDNHREQLVHRCSTSKAARGCRLYVDCTDCADRQAAAESWGNRHLYLRLVASCGGESEPQTVVEIMHSCQANHSPLHGANQLPTSCSKVLDIDIARLSPQTFPKCCLFVQISSNSRVATTGGEPSCLIGRAPYGLRCRPAGSLTSNECRRYVRICRRIRDS